MADVKIVDIDGSQWSIKDQEARNKIAELEKSLIPQSLENINITLNEGYSANRAILSSHFKIGKIHFATISLENINGNYIGTTTTALIGKIPINLFDNITVLLFNAYNSVTIRAYISQDGNIAIAESTGVPKGNNYIVGEIIFAEK